MYCEDNLGTDIDHFEPLASAPLRAFDWPNHLWACTHCNSNQKRHQYPCDAAGNCLLVDPTVDDPADHLRLLLNSGEYEALTLKGEETIRVFGLNRPDLLDGRREAYVRVRSNLRDWHRLQHEGDTTGEAELLAQALLRSPFINVVRSMERLQGAMAMNVMGSEVATAVEAWRQAHGA
ncbi:HNH endonuclease [Streptomyces sp. NPDC090741]|uniref:HNH endonuclease n=1 Tax=Streptomyces sp. NPDC090741 TaxID=3365967 RepID=UPI0037FEE2D9